MLFKSLLHILYEILIFKQKGRELLIVLIDFSIACKHAINKKFILITHSIYISTNYGLSQQYNLQIYSIGHQNTIKSGKYTIQNWCYA